jgi:hypothetical protein
MNVDELDLCFLQNKSISANNNKMHKHFARNYINVARIRTYLGIAYKDNSCLHSRLKNMNLYCKVKLKLSLCLSHAMKMYGRMEVWLHSVLTSALDAEE